MGISNIISGKHLPGLDGIRAFSVLAVIVSHAGGLKLGGLGVNTFFVLSGFLITWLLLKEYDRSSSISLKAFYARRTLRIFPAYYFFILITISADLFFDIDEIKPAILPALTYTMNYFNVVFDHPGLSVGHTWSLAIEEQFYLLWPFLLLTLLNKNIKLLIPTLSLIILMSIMWRSAAYIWFQMGDSYVYNSFETRVDSLAIGSLFSILLKRQLFQKIVDKMATFSIFSIMLVALAIWLHLNGSPIYRYSIGYTVSSVLAALIILQIIILSGRRKIWGFLEFSPIKYLGVISYPMYLWHSRCLEVVDKIGIVNVYSKILLGTLICIIVSSCSYYILEKPFLRLKRRFS